jgi:hypothetical protein
MAVGITLGYYNTATNMVVKSFIVQHLGFLLMTKILGDNVWPSYYGSFIFISLLSQLLKKITLCMHPPFLLSHPIIILCNCWQLAFVNKLCFSPDFLQNVVCSKCFIKIPIIKLLKLELVHKHFNSAVLNANV